MSMQENSVTFGQSHAGCFRFFQSLWTPGSGFYVHVYERNIPEYQISIVY